MGQFLMNSIFDGIPLVTSVMIDHLDQGSSRDKKCRYNSIM